MSDKARTLMSNTIVVDGLFHALMKDPPPECGIGKNIVDMILEGGVNCMVDSIISDQYSSSFNDLLNAIYDYKLLEDVLPSKYTVAESIADIEKAKEEGKLALIMSTQGSDFLQSDLRKISLAYKLGLRIVQVTYNNECSFGCGSYVKHDTGLTHFGEQAIIEMNRVGMVIDVSHVGHVTALQTIEASQDPVIYSHSGVQALTKHVRNTNDEHIKALAKKGGVLCVCPHCIMNTNNQDVRPTVDDYINSFIHIAEVTGSMDHAGIGTDRWSRNTMANDIKRVGFERTTKGFFGKFDGNSKHVEGFNYYNEWENLVEHMLARNISEADCKKLLGGNLLRVWKQVWK